MLKVLLKKQFMEVFLAYFFDAKKKRMRPKWQVALFFTLFAALMIVVLGGMFYFMADALCVPLVAADMGWLYFTIMCGVAILFGAFGSVFNTFTSLYLSKDNDLLLSLPIPSDDIVLSRIANVYLLGFMYSGSALIPTLIVYWMRTGFTVNSILCGVILLLLVTLIVLILSCALGWCVAKISLKLKNKSFVSVLASLIFIGLYYFFYFKAQDLLEELVKNVTLYGEKIKGAAYGLYLFGSIGTGNWLAACVFGGILAGMTVVTWIILSRTFVSIATSTGTSSKVKYVEKQAKVTSVDGALLKKELKRFTSSSA